MDTIELTKKLISINSVTGSEAQIQNYLYDFLESQGFSPQLVKVEDNREDIVCSAGHGKKKVMLNSHVDTVPVCEGWHTNPFMPTIKEGKLYGLGAYDQKAGAAIHINTFMDLADKIDGGLTLALVVDEEVYSYGTYKLYQEGLLKGFSAALFSEPNLTEKGYGINTSARGHYALDINVYGRATHGTRQGTGVNAISEAITLINNMKEFKFKKNKEVGQSEAIIDKINAESTSVSLPERCELRLRWFSVPGEDETYIIGQIEDAIRKSKCHAEVNWIKRPTPFLKPFITKDPAPLNAAKKAFATNKIKAKEMSFPSTFDAHLTSNLAHIPSINIGPLGYGAHQANEFVYTKSIKDIERVTKQTVQNLFSGSND